MNDEIRNSPSQSAIPGLISLGLHGLGVLALVFLAPHAFSPEALTPSHYQVVTLTFRPQSSLATARVHSGAKITHHSPTSAKFSPATVRVGELDQSRTAQPTHSYTSTSGVVVGNWNTARISSAMSTQVGTLGQTDLFNPARQESQHHGPLVERAVDQSAKLLSTPLPAYTEEARRLRITGEVALEVILTAAGTVHVLRVLSGLGHGLDEAAITAVNHTRCRPALRVGQPTDVTATITVVFNIT